MLELGHRKKTGTPFSFLIKNALQQYDIMIIGVGVRDDATHYIAIAR